MDAIDREWAALQREGFAPDPLPLTVNCRCAPVPITGAIFQNVEFECPLCGARTGGRMDVDFKPGQPQTIRVTAPLRCGCPPDRVTAAFNSRA